MSYSKKKLKLKNIVIYISAPIEWTKSLVSLLIAEYKEHNHSVSLNVYVLANTAK